MRPQTLLLLHTLFEFVSPTNTHTHTRGETDGCTGRWLHYRNTYTDVYRYTGGQAGRCIDDGWKHPLYAWLKVG
jgi:hypothetical protein